MRHLDRQCDELTHRANTLRHEQVTDEIEVLLLSIRSIGRHTLTKTSPMNVSNGRCAARLSHDLVMLGTNLCSMPSETRGHLDALSVRSKISCELDDIGERQLSPIAAA